MELPGAGSGERLDHKKKHRAVYYGDGTVCILILMFLGI